MSLDALDKVKGIVSLYQHHASPKIAQFRAKRYLPGPWFLLQGQVRACELTCSFSNCVGCCQKGPLISWPIQSAELWDEWLGWEEVADRILRRNWCGADSTCCITDSIKKPIHEQIGMPYTWILPTGQWAPSVLLTHYTNIHTVASLSTLWLLYLVLTTKAVREGFGWQLDNTQRKLAHICRPETDHKFLH